MYSSSSHQSVETRIAELGVFKGCTSMEFAKFLHEEANSNYSTTRTARSAATSLARLFMPSNIDPANMPGQSYDC